MSAPFRPVHTHTHTNDSPKQGSLRPKSQKARAGAPRPALFTCEKTLPPIKTRTKPVVLPFTTRRRKIVANSCRPCLVCGRPPLPPHPLRPPIPFETSGQSGVSLGSGRAGTRPAIASCVHSPLPPPPPPPLPPAARGGRLRSPTSSAGTLSRVAFHPPGNVSLCCSNGGM